MKHRGIYGLAMTSLTLILASLAAPDRAKAEQAPSSFSNNSVRFIGEAAPPAPASYDRESMVQTLSPMTILKPIDLGEFNRGPLNLRLSLSPQASMSSSARGEQSSAGAQVRLGPSRKAGVDQDRTWYVFAGARGRAVTWNMGATAFDLDDFAQLKRKVIIGDFQAGIAYQMGETQMSLGYVKRSYRSGFYKETESFGAVTIGWRR